MKASQFQSRDRVDDIEVPDTLPVLPLINTVVFPRMTLPLSVGREKSLAAVGAALKADRLILLAPQKEPSKEEVAPDDLRAMGTVAVIGQVLKMPDGSSQVVVHGYRRARILECRETEGRLEAAVEVIVDPSEKSVEVEALMRTVLAELESYVEKGQSVPSELVIAARNVEEPGWLADLVAYAPELTMEQRQQLLETLDPAERLRTASLLLMKQLEILDVKQKIQQEIQQGMEKTQREYFLREQLKAIQRELGEGDPQQMELADLRKQVDEAGMPEEVQARALKEIDRLAAMPPASPETGMIRTYVDWLVSLPWAKGTEDMLDIQRAGQVLHEDHYGLEKVKDRILEYLAVRRLSGGKLRSPILCFVGPPGVGKTSLGRSIARAMGRKFVRLSLGGIRDEAEIRGHRRTYIGSLPGRIVRGMRDASTRNPVFMLDEVDKLGYDFRGDPASALLEVLDPEQNYTFSDHYLEVPFDLSKVLFITTANLLDPIPPALRDRMEVIIIPGYTEEEKVHIARQFLIPRQLDEHGLRAEQLTFVDEALRHLIREYTKEAGVRNLERELAKICRKVAKRIAERLPAGDGRATQPVEANGDAEPAAAAGQADGVDEQPADAPVLRAGHVGGGASHGAGEDAQGHAEPPSEPTATFTVTPEDLPDYLGPPQFDWAGDERKEEVGVAYGLAVTEVGGDLIDVEATWMEAHEPQVTLTGQLGQVMQESARAAVSYARARSREFGVEPEFFDRHALHVHVPAGGVPKDGPSAGITMATAIVSALTSRPVRSDVAMTGEITLRGRVLPIGGVKQKVLAAHRSGIKAVILPGKNKKDLTEIPEDVRTSLEILWAEHMDEVLQHAVLPKVVQSEVPLAVEQAAQPTTVQPEPLPEPAVARA